MKRLLVLLAAIAMATTGMAADNLWTGNVDTDWATAGNWISGISGAGTINQTGGALTIASETSLGRYGNSVGTVNLSGGSFSVTDGALSVGYEATGIFNQTGGDLEVERLRLAQNTAAAPGFYSISGGSLSITAYITGGTSGAGVFEVDGFGATSVEAANISFYDDTLRVVLDGNGSSLMVADKAINTAYNGQFDMRGVFELDTDGTFNGTVGDVYNIGWASDAALTNGRTTFPILSGTDFEMRIIDNVDRYGNAGTGQLLQVTVIPEPATLGLLAFGGAMVWIRRKSVVSGINYKP